MIYSISQDVASGSVNPDKLQAEIIASNSVEGFVGIMIRGDELEVLGAVTNQESLDAVVHNHVSLCLGERRKTKNAAIDTRTQAIIAQGFQFDGKTFSLSINAQMNGMGLLALKDLFSWPMDVTTNDDQQYSLSLENLIPFIGIGSNTVATAIGTGRALKLQVNAAATQEEIDAVVDSR